MTERPFDATALIATLAAHEVDYLVIGGVAAQVHGHRRTTRDLDIVPAPRPGNHERLVAALEELGVMADAEQLRVAPIAPPFLTRHGELHILNEVNGAAPYDDMRARALVVTLDGVPVAIAGVGDLIAMKRASGRPQDLDDITAIVAVARAATPEAPG